MGEKQDAVMIFSKKGDKAKDEALRLLLTHLYKIIEDEKNDYDICPDLKELHKHCVRLYKLLEQVPNPIISKEIEVIKGFIAATGKSIEKKVIEIIEHHFNDYYPKEEKSAVLKLIKRILKKLIIPEESPVAEEPAQKPNNSGTDIDYGKTVLDFLQRAKEKDKPSPFIDKIINNGNDKEDLFTRLNTFFSTLDEQLARLKEAKQALSVLKKMSEQYYYLMICCVRFPWLKLLFECCPRWVLASFVPDIEIPRKATIRLDTVNTGNGPVLYVREKVEKGTGKEYKYEECACTVRMSTTKEDSVRVQEIEELWYFNKDTQNMIKSLPREDAIISNSEPRIEIKVPPLKDYEIIVVLPYITFDTDLLAEFTFEGGSEKDTIVLTTCS